MKKGTFLDLYRYVGEFSLKLWIKSFLFTPGFTYIVIYRKAKNSRNIFLKIIFRGWLRLLQMIYHFQIPYQTDIGEGFYIGHFGSIIINSKARLGKNVNVTSGVVIGQTNRGKKQGIPTIGDEVWIGANSVIVGNITIGKNVLIAPNSYVNFDVPDNSIVMGNPAKIIYNLKATEGYVHNKI